MRGRGDRSGEVCRKSDGSDWSASRSGELLAGVVLGPTVLNIWAIPWLTQATGPIQLRSQLFQDPADLGVVVLMFIAGVETDLTMMRRTVAPAFWAATGGVLLPMAGGYFLSRSYGFTVAEAIFIGTS